MFDLSLSDEARLLVRPFHTYRRLADLPVELGASALFLRRPLHWLVITASFASLTTAGRLVGWHLGFQLIGWAPVVALQAVLAVAWARIAGSRSAARSVDLYFAGQGPWFVWMLAVAAVCLFAPRAWPAFEWLLGTGLFPAAIVGTLLWSALLTFAFFRSALARPPALALFYTMGFYAAYVGVFLLYFGATGQLTVFRGPI